MDDACPTMRREIWDPLEATLDSLGICPIVGVIPDNGDSSMLCSESDVNFWERVRNWEKKGWGIALHGLHHIYHQTPSDSHALLPIYNRSEFTGLSLDKQCEILRESWRIFSENGVKPSIFMAPSHNFDINTLKALCLETDIRIVTDGHALFPFRQDDFVWIPQQLWHFRWLPFGIWTVCLHPNTLSPSELNFHIEQLTRFAGNVVSYKMAIERCNKGKTLFDKIFTALFGIALHIKTNA